MPDDASTQTPPNQDNAKEISRLSSELAKAQADLTAAQTKIKEFEGQVGGLTTANKQANEQVTTLKAQVDDLTKQLQAKDGELTNWKTQHQQVTEQAGKLQSDLSVTQQELGLFKLIASKPEYHGLVGYVSAIKIVADPKEQESLIQMMANGMKAQTDAALALFRAGGTPAAGTGVNNGGNQGPTGPKTVQEAHARMQQILGVPGHEKEVAALQAFLLNPPNPANSGAA
jgi:uncharacterized phage infection (PIP) family protein YhgE